MAPNAPCSVRAATSISNETAAPPMAEETANPARPVTKTHLRLNMSPSLLAHQQQATEGQGVGRHHPLPVAVREPQRTLGRRQRDVHDRGIQHHHQLGDSYHDQDQPAPVDGGWLVLDGR